ncbi:MAG TPA: metallophosphoesterase family protein [Thermoleophilaceae bacterium]|nr:metallophosphoesterase family protein [Thermoleophilaceae bacterium]
MRIALLSDVHGNLPAFQAVLADVDAQAPDEVWCLGDLVGYGAQPDGCVELARDSCDLSLAGNHDLVVTGEIPITDFSSSAAAAARWTQETIGEETMAFLKGLVPADADREPALYHASPRDPVWEYVLSTWQADECIDLMEARVGAVGHSHVALWFRRDDSGKMSGATADAGSEHDLSAGRWLVNPGGVGQPRDGDPRAAWLLLDTGEWTATWRRVEYPIEEAARAIEEAGLPRVLAERLFSGQ